MENTDLQIMEEHDSIQHLWIIQKASSRMIFYQDFESELELDGILLSGLLSALNHFSEFELHERGIESVDMASMRWVYYSSPESKLLLVGAGQKRCNAKLMIARLRVIERMFVQQFDIDDNFWDEWGSEITQFKGFSGPVLTLYNQWKEARDTMNVGEIFDILGEFQQIFILLINVVNNNFAGEKLFDILNKLAEYSPKLEEWHKKVEMKDSMRIIEIFLPRIDLKKKIIRFDEAVSNDIFGLNPYGFQREIMESLFMLVMRHFIKVLRSELGTGTWYSIFTKNIKPHFDKKWKYLEEEDLLKLFFDAFFD